MSARPATGAALLLHATAWLRPHARRGPGRGAAADASYLNRRLLRMVLWARAIVALAAGALLALGSFGGREPLPLVAAGMVAALAAVSWIGIAHARAAVPVTQGDLLLQVVFDVAALTLALALVGRESPFDYLYLLPLVFAACAFNGVRMGLVAILIAGAWTVLHFLDQSTAMLRAAEVAAHIAAGTLVAYFAFAVARLARRHERLLSGRREGALSAMSAERQGHIAARAAHALSTPLGTMAVIVADLRAGRIPRAERAAALEVLEAQIEACKHQLSGLLDDAGVKRGDGACRASVDDLLCEVREECLLHYPACRMRLMRQDTPEALPDVVCAEPLFNALAGLVKSVVRVPPHGVRIDMTWDAANVALRISRDVEGLAAAAAPAAAGGEPQDCVGVLATILESQGATVDVLTDGCGALVKLPRAPAAADVPNEANNTPRCTPPWTR